MIVRVQWTRTVPLFHLSLYDKLGDLPREILEGEHDVFGDGTVRIIPAPGHTPGHQMLLVNLAEEGLVMLSGDLYHFRESRADRRVPSLNVDAAQTLASMERIEQLLTETGAQLWIQHDMAGFLERSGTPAHR